VRDLGRTSVVDRVHWLTEDAVRRLYGDLAGKVRRGGVLAYTE
jgi:hypothetical protein